MLPASTSAPAGRVCTVTEAASMLRISRGSAYEAAKRREIPTIRIGRRLLVPYEALERMLCVERETEQAQTADGRGGNRTTVSPRCSSGLLRRSADMRAEQRPSQMKGEQR